MRVLRDLCLLFFISCAIEAALVGLYYYEAHGPLQSAIEEHTAMLQSGTIPDASQIDIRNAPWAKVAHFEEVFGELHLLIDPVFALVILWFFMRRGISRALRDIATRNNSNVHFKRATYLCLYILSSTFTSFSSIVIFFIALTYCIIFNLILNFCRQRNNSLIILLIISSFLLWL